MGDYIERTAILKFPIRKNHCDKEHANEHFINGIETVLEYAENLPAADAAPVVHGRWEGSTDDWLGTDVYTCTKCRESYVLVEGTPKQNLWHYCPNCGAKMDGGDGDAAD